MLRKKSFYLYLLLLGIVIFLLGVFLRFTGISTRAIEGICIGIGSGLFGTSLGNFFMKVQEEKDPESRKRKEIEFYDERNALIRFKAKAKVGDMVQWLVMGIAYLTILISAPIWVTLMIVGVFVLKHVLELYYMAKFQKEM